jgi:acyl-CoA synthetase (AMP-forming)/AMP-acid ligase II
MLRQVRELHGNRILARRGSREITYAQAELESAEMALGLAFSGVGKGTRVGLLLPNSPDWIVAWLAAARVGALAIGISTFLKPRELGWLVRFADIDTLIMADTYLRHDYIEDLEAALPSLAGHSGHGPLRLTEAPFLRTIWMVGDRRPEWTRGGVDDIRTLGRQHGSPAGYLRSLENQVYPADLAVTIFTSGTTADPKGVVHSHGTVVRRAYELFDYGPCGAGEKVGVMTPLFWIGGLLTNFLNTMIGGGTLVFPERPDPGYMVEFLRREQLDYLNGWAGQFHAIRQHPDFTDELFTKLKPTGGTQGRAGIVGPRSDVPLQGIPSLLGMTESFGPHSGEVPGSRVPEHLHGSHGRAIGRVERKIVDIETGAELPAGEVGELTIRSDLLLEGYYKREHHEVFDVNGFLRTGDRCHLSEDGHLFFHGRTGEMIKTSGANVAPQEVEQVLLSFSDVKEAYVFGRPDDAIGEMVIAVVVPSADAALNAEELRGRLSAQLSAYKVPKLIAITQDEALPRSSSEKVQKHKLLEMVEAGALDAR